MTEWEWYKEPSTCHLFIHLLLKANYIEKTWKGKVVKRGQLITSLNNLSAETGLSRQTVRLSLSRLELSNEITIVATHSNSTITICKYDNYQTEKKKSNTQTSTPNNTTSSPPNNTATTHTLAHNLARQTTLTKEVIEVKEVKESKEEKEIKNNDRSIDFEILENEILEIWNNTVGDIVPKIKKLTEARKRQFKAILPTMGASCAEQVEMMKNICLKINNSDYLSGRLDSTIPIKWDWVMECEDNWRKIHEGKYDNRKVATVAPVVKQPTPKYEIIRDENYFNYGK